jgi:hypothetical protein
LRFVFQEVLKLLFQGLLFGVFRLTLTLKPSFAETIDGGVQCLEFSIVFRPGRLVVGYGLLVIGICFDFETDECFKDFGGCRGFLGSGRPDDSAP